MKELTDDQKQSVWTRLAALVGLSDKAAVTLSDYVAKDGSTISIDDTTGAVSGDVQDGEYELEDGKILVITAGKLDTILDAPVAAAVADAPAAAPDAPTVEDPQAALDALQAQIDELKALVESLTGGNAALTDANTTLSAKLCALEALPADKKVTLSVQSETAGKSPAQTAWERYNKK